MLLDSKVQLRILLPEIVLHNLIGQCVSLLMNTIAITMDLQTVIGQMDKVVLVVQCVAV